MGISGSEDSADAGAGFAGNSQCRKTFSATLEQVERSAYFIAHKSIPPPGTGVIVNLGARICVETLDSVLLGYLPKEYNYLVMCVSSGFSYAGVITSSALAPNPSISVEIRPTGI